MPRFRSIGLAPAATDLAPSRTIAWASTVAVVVPSPATSEVLEATSRTICAPMFSNLSSSSISLATVTPSLVTRGAPKDFSSTTLRPLGPSVTLTALARMSTPRSMRSRASWENLTSLAAMAGYLQVVRRGRDGASDSDRTECRRASPCTLIAHPRASARVDASAKPRYQTEDAGREGRDQAAARTDTFPSITPRMSLSFMISSSSPSILTSVPTTCRTAPGRPS